MKFPCDDCPRKCRDFMGCARWCEWAREEKMKEEEEDGDGDVKT